MGETIYWLSSFQAKTYLNIHYSLRWHSNGIVRTCTEDIGYGRENTTHRGNLHGRHVCTSSRGPHRLLRIRWDKLCWAICEINVRHVRRSFRNKGGSNIPYYFSREGSFAFHFLKLFGTPLGKWLWLDLAAYLILSRCFHKGLIKSCCDCCGCCGRSLALWLSLK